MQLLQKDKAIRQSLFHAKSGCLAATDISQEFRLNNINATVCSYSTDTRPDVRYCLLSCRNSNRRVNGFLRY